MHASSSKVVQYPVPDKTFRLAPIMQAVTFSTFRKNLRAYLDQVRDDCEPLLVTSKDPSANVIVINAEEYDNLLENLRVYSNDYLLQKLLNGKAEMESGETFERGLVSADETHLD